MDGNSTAHGAEARIAAAALDVEPFPHLVVDDVLAPDVFADISRYWPASAGFAPTGIPGNGMFHFELEAGRLAPTAHAFWTEFARGPLAGLVRASLRRFAPIYAAKFGTASRDVSFSLKLQEALPGFVDHEVHTHHWHDPHWLFTALLYVDDGGAPASGTTLHGVEGLRLGRDDSRLAEIAAKTLQWEDMPEIVPVRAPAFRPNRLLVFLDSPVSLHGVAPPTIGHGSGRAGGRRIVRTHASLPESVIGELFGVPPAEYRVHRRRSSRKEFVISWLRKEIEKLSRAIQAPDLGAGEAFAANARFDGPPFAR